MIIYIHRPRLNNILYNVTISSVLYISDHFVQTMFFSPFFNSLTKDTAFHTEIICSYSGSIFLKSLF